MSLPIARNICLRIERPPRNYRAYSRDDETQSGSPGDSNVASGPNSCRRAVGLFYYSFADRESRERYVYIYIYMHREGYKVTRCRELKPPRFSSGFLPVEKNNRRAKRSWLANERRERALRSERRGGQQKKEKGKKGGGKLKKRKEHERRK